MMNSLYTIGHSIYEIGDFIKLLRQNSINTIVDVRSAPYSKFAPQYNMESLKQKLKQNAISYIFMGDVLGARYEDKNLLFFDGKVDFKKVQETKKFQNGILRLEHGIIKGYNISLMCSEKEAFDCHRFGLISEYLSKNNFKISHIYPNKVLSQEELEKQLMEKYHKKIDYLGVTTDKIPIGQAYELRNRDIAYNGFTQEGDDE